MPLSLRIKRGSVKRKAEEKSTSAFELHRKSSATTIQHGQFSQKSSKNDLNPHLIPDQKKYEKNVTFFTFKMNGLNSGIFFKNIEIVRGILIKIGPVLITTKNKIKMLYNFWK